MEENAAGITTCSVTPSTGGQGNVDTRETSQPASSSVRTHPRVIGLRPSAVRRIFIELPASRQKRPLIQMRLPYIQGLPRPSQSGRTLYLSVQVPVDHTGLFVMLLSGSPGCPVGPASRFPGVPGQPGYRHPRLQWLAGHIPGLAVKPIRPYLVAQTDLPALTVQPV